MNENAYEIYRDEFNHELMRTIPGMVEADILRILAALDAVSARFCIARQNTDLITVDNMPEIVRVYVASKKIEGMSEQTLSGFVYQMRIFTAHIRKPLEHVTTNDIRVYLYKYQEERKVSNATLNHIRIMISSFFHWAAAEGYITHDPCLTVKPIKAEQKQRQSLSQVELEYVRRGCKTIRERAMVEFMYSTGCRVSELIKVKKTDVNFLIDEVILYGKGKKYRTSYLNAKAHVVLKDYLATRTDDCPYLFITERKPHRQMSKACAERIVSGISDASGIEKSITPHIFRHTTATQAVANGMPVSEVQKLLGHASISTTMIYVETADTNVKTDHRKAVI